MADPKPEGSEAVSEGEPKTAPATTPAAAPNGLMLLIGVAALGVVLGGTLGSLVLAPALIAARHPKPAVAKESADEESSSDEDQDHGKKGKHDGEKKNSVYRIDNVIVNPAGSQGSRFLMASVAFEVRDPKVEARLRERDIQVRDVVTATRESQTLEMLSRPGARDSLRHQLANVVRPLAGGARLQVYLPQLVIQ